MFEHYFRPEARVKLHYAGSSLRCDCSLNHINKRSYGELVNVKLAFEDFTLAILPRSLSLNNF
jgi:hypothetical protein